MFKYISILFAIVASITGCSKATEPIPPDPEGVVLRAIVVSEGQYGYSTGSLSALYSDGTVVNNIFKTVNGNTIGDVPQSLEQIGDYYYIPVNNSNKIEVVECDSFKSVETMQIPHKMIPMYVEHLGGDLIAVSDQCSSAIPTPGTPSSSTLTIMNINHTDKDREIVEAKIEMPTPTFQMQRIGDKLFVCCAEFSVFDQDNLTTEGRRLVGGGGLEIVDFSKICVDAQGMIWVMTTAGIKCINPDSETVTLSIPIVFDNIDIDANGRHLYCSTDKNFADGSWGAEVYTIDTQSPKVPTKPIFTHNRNDSWTTYAMSVSPDNTIFIARVQYGTMTRGRIFEYTTDGEIVNNYPDYDGVMQPYFSAGIFSRYIFFPSAD